jgi:serine protease Do
MRHLASRALLLPALLLAGCGKDDPTGPTRLTILDCEDGQRYAIGATVNGTLTASDCREPGGTAAFADYYEVVLQSAGPISITLRPTAGPDEVVAVLLRPDETQVDFAFAQQGETASVGGDLPAGTYYLFVAALESTQLISYALSSSFTLPPAFGCATVTPYTIGATVTGALSQSDCLAPESELFADVFRFAQNAPGPVAISVEPAAGTVIAGLLILSGAGEEVMSAEYGLPGSPAIVGGNLPAGNYLVAVIGSEVGQTGGYTITSSRTLPPPPPPFLGCTTSQPYTLGGNVAGSLATSDCLVDNGYYMDRYDFTLTEARSVTIDLASGQFDTFLLLFDAAGQVIAANDDAFGGTFDSRVTINLAPGSYAIGATSFFGRTTGAYSLSSMP